MFGFVWWIVIGLVAGLLGRAIMPGRQPMSWLLTLGLGLTGSIVGGLISSVLFRTDPTEAGFHAGGLVMSTVGAVIVLAVYSRIHNSRTGDSTTIPRE
jgi:uncharacterized membrane protein YeaQ/YmgE (transglycosylase-associated protein family)